MTKRSVDLMGTASVKGVANNFPWRIWASEEGSYGQGFEAMTLATWSESKIYHSDCEFIRADLLKVPPAVASETMLQAGAMEYAMTAQRPNAPESHARDIYAAMIRAGGGMSDALEDLVYDMATIRDFVKREFVEGDKAYQLAIVADEALKKVGR